MGGLMERIPLTLGRAAGVLGVFLCLMAFGVRLTGNYWIAGFPTAAVFQFGIASMVAGCFFLLVVLTMRSRRG